VPLGCFRPTDMTRRQLAFVRFSFIQLKSGFCVGLLVRTHNTLERYLFIARTHES
jgi:hypothetical protein